ncbi:hypothetical protein LRM47_01485 [Candidatus Nanosynbacter sp. TM7-076]|uniref:hypothetical protein n=1 Tax=Candidatus Nanosynbacter sp. TM7-076 TaxID=2902629 RepID=UPI00101BEBA5|nr:hypothetical protein [Candidatus Nanosynbacter sp. TM7-076]MCJ1967705.1 hypothetical protein [Candidatus Nanosynbacter sp. TM7-076]
MDANKKPQMTREMMERLYGRMNTLSDNSSRAYGDTGRMLTANRSVNSERRYIKGYGSSISANNSDNRRRFGAEMGVAPRSRVANNNPDDAGLSGGNRRVNGLQNNNVQSSVDNSRRSFNANRTTFREPPSRGYNPFG